MLQVDGVDVYYGGVQALRGISIEVGEGEVVALVGANGAGKSTTLRAISGLVRPKRGEVRFGGRPLNDVAPQEIVRLGLSHVPEGRGIFAKLTVRENLRMGTYTHRADRLRSAEDLERVLELFPRLAERIEQRAGSLSGGEQQMLALARALVSRPRLLMVDELSLGLAPLIVQQLFGIVRDINRDGVAILLVEQYVNLALEASERAYVLGKGRVVASGKSRDLLADNELVRSSYLGRAGQKSNGKRAPRKTKKAVRT